ncbi:hypothetical protein [Cryobacterium sp. M15]|jgi:hypothetical protein|uniref:hypothetical protein n=1 Tax=Cryobacterium sp. M15 TaxID=2048291 RepID=UPI0011B08989|nr:hypothetical protein [Cryobacterium sp. M15]
MTESNDNEMATPDESTHLSEAQKQRTETLGDGATPESTQENAEEDTASGGAPEDPDGVEEDGTPVENPSG